MKQSNKSLESKKKPSTKRKRVLFRKIYRPDMTGKRKKHLLKTVFAFAVILVVIFSVIGFITFRSFYNHYEEIVETRIQTGFWQSRSGIYAAPKTFRVGQKLSRNSLIANLRKAGYVKGLSDSFWNGTYLTEDNVVTVKNNSLFEEQEEEVSIEFDKDTIVKISSEKSVIPSFRIKPELLTGRSEAKRTRIKALKYNQIPENLRNAIVVTEDRKFFNHNGLDYKGILRAFWSNLTEQKITQGGSTITQQLVKNTFLTSERTYKRKLSEAFLAWALEEKMNKEEIFTLYCNEIYLGQYGTTGVHGFGMASKVYFGKNIKDLTLAESVSLATMIRRPNHFTRGRRSDELKSRRELILNLMEKVNLISSDQNEVAKNDDVIFANPKAEIDAIAPYFVDQVAKEIPKKIFAYETDDDLRVYTTIDTQVQQIAEDSLEKHLSELEKSFSKKNLKPQATLIAMDPHNGEILAVVGGSDYAETQYNRATQAKRQPGSVFKPFIYATALERGLLPSSAFADKKMEFTYDRNRKYKPSNYGDYYQNRKISLKTALAKSSNVVAVQTALRAGLHNVSRTASEFGFDNVKPYPSVALGTIEVTPVQLAAAYSSFANSGRKITPTYIKHIRAGDGSIIYQSELSREKIISDETAYMLTDMMQAVVKRGTARRVKNSLGDDVVFGGKTGSSKDAWFVGYTPNIVTVAWVGLDENEDIGLTGGETALPLWTSFMKELLSKRPEFGGKTFERPIGLIDVTIDPETGLIADPNCPHKERVVIPKSASSSIHCFRHKVYPDTQIAATTYEVEKVDFDESFIDHTENEIKIDKKEKSLKRRMENLENDSHLKNEKDDIEKLPEVIKAESNLTNVQNNRQPKPVKKRKSKSKKPKFKRKRTSKTKSTGRKTAADLSQASRKKVIETTQ